MAVPVRPGLRLPCSLLARAAALALIACAGPATTSPDALPAGAAAPRFAPGGFDAEADEWQIECEDGHHVRTRFLIACTGFAAKVREAVSGTTTTASSTSCCSRR